LSISRTSSSNVASYPEEKARTTISIAPMAGITRIRTSSRNLRRSRFRSTIVCPCFPTITATRACKSRESLARTSRCSVRSRLPALFTSSISDSRVSLWLREYPYSLRAGVLARQPDRQLLSSFLATTAQDLTTPSCRHSFPKPVCTNTTLVAGTVGWLTHLKLQISD
jgi:hypothetical protein